MNTYFAQVGVLTELKILFISALSVEATTKKINLDILWPIKEQEGFLCFDKIFPVVGIYTNCKNATGGHIIYAYIFNHFINKISNARVV